MIFKQWIHGFDIPRQPVLLVRTIMISTFFWCFLRGNACKFIIASCSACTLRSIFLWGLKWFSPYDNSFKKVPPFWIYNRRSMVTVTNQHLIKSTHNQRVNDVLHLCSNIYYFFFKLFNRNCMYVIPTVRLFIQWKNVITRFITRVECTLGVDIWIFDSGNKLQFL